MNSNVFCIRKGPGATEPPFSGTYIVLFKHQLYRDPAGCDVCYSCSCGA